MVRLGPWFEYRNESRAFTAEMVQATEDLRRDVGGYVHGFKRGILLGMPNPCQVQNFREVVRACGDRSHTHLERESAMGLRIL